ADNRSNALGRLSGLQFTREPWTSNSPWKYLPILAAYFMGDILARILGALDNTHPWILAWGMEPWWWILALCRDRNISPVS
ncbi:MAG: hypothetical protein ACREJQ_02860, partial [bacterium]